MRKSLYFFVFVSLAGSALAKYNPQAQNPNGPWLTGPLLAPSAHVTTVGHVNEEPYFLLININGQYDSDWHKISEPSFWISELKFYTTIGLTEWMDFAIDPGGAYQHCRGAGEFISDNVHMGFDFQLLEEQPDNYLPAIKLGVREIFPITKYNHLDPKKFKTDSRGFGSYRTEIFLCAGRLIQLRDDHWLNLRLAVAYSVSSRLHVRGFNIYGGSADTDAYVYPPQLFALNFSFELTLNKNWVIACDGVAGYGKSRKFKGYPGRLETGELADLSKGSALSFELAPAIEYNWSRNIGIVTGTWFSIAGRNSDSFASWVTGVNIYF
jgi:hypothetical protein